MYEYAAPRRMPRKKRETARHAKPRHRKPDRSAVVTLLEDKLRASVDQATETTFHNTHVESVADAIRAVREHAPRALLVSTTMVDHDVISEIGRIVAKNPGMLPVAVAYGDAPPTGDLLLTLGACGIRRFLDLNGRNGWENLRSLLDEGGGEVEASILRGILADLGEANDACRHFFAALVHHAPTTTTVRTLARILGIRASTLMSRFFRATIPSPKSYLAMTRLVYAAAYFEQEQVSLVDVANSLNFSSPQSFGRHVRMILGLSGGEFRRQVCFQGALDHYTARLIAPYAEVFCSFNPLGPGYVRMSNGSAKNIASREVLVG